MINARTPLLAAAFAVLSATGVLAASFSTTRPSAAVPPAARAVGARAKVAGIPALGTALPQAATAAGAVMAGVSAPGQADSERPALAGLESEAARVEAAAQAGQGTEAASSDSQAAFDGSVKTTASPDALPELNKAVAEILKPFNNNLTKATVMFNRVETNAQRATHVDLTVDYSKKGPDGDAALKISKLTYAYPDGGEPKTDGRIALEFNLLNVISQAQVNQLGPEADKLVAQFLADYTKRYGAAAAIDARVTRNEVDAQGNLTALGLTLGVKVDLAKLPAKVDPRDVEFTAAQLDLQITLQGLEASFAVTSNPKSRSFERGQQGLKEELEKLLARDPQQLRQIGRFIQTIDGIAAALTDKTRRLF